MSLVLSIATILIPHTEKLNPHAVTISVDTRYNIEWLKTLERNGIISGLHDLSKTLRPLYLIYIYYLHKLVHVPLGTFGDIILPSIALTILSIITAFLYGGWASFFVPLFLGPAFLYGGFQTNLYAMSLSFVLFYLIDRKAFRKSFLFLTVVLGLWHPWTLAYVTVAYFFLTLIRRDPQDLKGVLMIICSWALTLIIDYVLGGFKASPGIVRPGITPRPDPFFALFIYVWGTLARPEILFPVIIYLIFSEELSILNVATGLSFIALPILNYCGAYRVLLSAPLPLLFGLLFERKKGLLDSKDIRFLLLIPVFAAWMYLIVSSVPT